MCVLSGCQCVRMGANGCGCVSACWCVLVCHGVCVYARERERTRDVEVSFHDKRSNPFETTFEGQSHSKKNLHNGSSFEPAAEK